MYEYKVVRIKINMWTQKPEEDYREIIKEYAEAGWRFLQLVPKSRHGNAHEHIDLIFERIKDQYV